MSRMGGGMGLGGTRGARMGGDKDADKAPLKLSLIVRMMTYTRPYALKRNTLFALAALRAIQLPLLPLVVSHAISGPIKEEDFEGIATWTAVFGALALVTAATFRYRQMFALQLGESVVHDLRTEIFAKLQRLPMRFYDKTKLGRIISRMTSDAEAVRTGVQDVLFVTIVQAGQALVAAAIMAYADWVLFCVLLLMAPGLWWITTHFRSKLSVAWRDVQESFSRVTSRLAESVNGMRVTQGFVRQDVNARQFEELVADHSRYNIRTAELSGVFLPLLELNNQLFLSILLLVGGSMALGVGPLADLHQPKVDTLILFFFMAGMFFGPIASIGRQYNQSLTAMAGAERVFELLDTEEDRLDADDAYALPTIRGEVAFDDVNFAYEPGKPVLHDLSFRAQPGQTIALVGHTGSGKSTVIKLISKFYLPTAGAVTIDGHGIHRVTTPSLINQLGIVLQANFLFTGSVMDNIRMGRLDATDDQVVDAAKKLDCLDLFEALPDGFHTQVGEKGMSLSLGQRQLVCFARAMLADPRILILDEATSSVDTMTEARIQQALSKLLAGRTSFVVAHRLSTIRHADQVLVLDHGRLIERGTHNELLATGGVYANLYRQFIRAAEA